MTTGPLDVLCKDRHGKDASLPLLSLLSPSVFPSLKRAHTLSTLLPASPPQGTNNNHTSEMGAKFCACAKCTSGSAHVSRGSLILREERKESRGMCYNSI